MFALTGFRQNGALTTAAALIVGQLVADVVIDLVAFGTPSTKQLNMQTLTEVVLLCTGALRSFAADYSKG